MTKFYYEVMANEDGQCFVCAKERYTKEEALELAKKELYIDNEENELIVETSFIQYGFFIDMEGEVYNGWNIDNIFEPVQRRNKSQVEVWFITEYIPEYY